jgi:hypothetical protein
MSRQISYEQKGMVLCRLFWNSQGCGPGLSCDGHVFWDTAEHCKFVVLAGLKPEMLFHLAALHSSSTLKT